MRQSLSLVTLGVADYGRAKAFYEALGWSPALDIEETAFFAANGVIVVLWAREARRRHRPADDGASWSGITLAHNVGSRDEVHECRAARRTARRSRASPRRRSTVAMPASSAISTVTPGRSRTTRASASNDDGSVTLPSS